MPKDRRFSWQDIKMVQKGRHFTSYINKPFEDALVFLIANYTSISADAVTVFTDLLAFISAYLMIIGYHVYSVGLMLAVMILDGTDGKLARIRGKPTKIGKLEHSLDFLYEQVWYASLVYAAYTSASDAKILIAGLLWLAVDGYVRHIYQLGWIVMGSPVKSWGDAGRIVTTIDGRRNVYIWYALLSYLLTKSFSISILLSLFHSSFTAVSYTLLSFKTFKKIRS
ncbi:MAG: hypothetical protein DRN81_01920 [Thermoproteota archaeon]|nr:MAG: hypothetical protein DRN81_01920 [Candidatus Korarchaeota archaeon]